MKNKKNKNKTNELFSIDSMNANINDITFHKLSDCAVLPYITKDRIKPNEIFVLGGISYSGLFKKKSKDIVGIVVLNMSNPSIDDTKGDYLVDINRTYPILKDKKFRGFFILPNFSIAIDYEMVVSSSDLSDDMDGEYDENDIISFIMSNKNID